MRSKISPNNSERMDRLQVNFDSLRLASLHQNINSYGDAYYDFEANSDLGANFDSRADFDHYSLGIK